MGGGLQNFVKSLDLDALEWANMHFWYPWDTKSACLPILGHPNSINWEFFYPPPESGFGNFFEIFFQTQQNLTNYAILLSHNVF